MVAVPVPGSGDQAEEPEKKLEVRYLQTHVRCGDEVKLMARSQNIDNGESVKMEVKQKGSTIFTYNGTLQGGAADGLWQCKVQTDDHPEPKFTLEGSAAGINATSPNDCTIKKYENIAAQTKTIPCSSPPFGWTGKFDIELKSGQIIVTTKIKLLNRNGAKPGDGDPMPEVSGTVSAADKATMKSDIEGKLSAKHLFHRKGCKRGNGCDCSKTRSCCKIKVKVVVKFVESGEHHRVNLFQGAGRANSGNWTRTKTRANSYAHETGHLLGWYDEYAGGAVGSAPRWKVQGGVVMNTGLRVPKEYYWDFRNWLKAKTGEDWDIVAP